MLHDRPNTAIGSAHYIQFTRSSAVPNSSVFRLFRWSDHLPDDIPGDCRARWRRRTAWKEPAAVRKRRLFFHSLERFFGGWQIFKLPRLHHLQRWRREMLRNYRYDENPPQVWDAYLSSVMFSRDVTVGRASGRKSTGRCDVTVLVSDGRWRGRFHSLTKSRPVRRSSVYISMLHWGMGTYSDLNLRKNLHCLMHFKYTSRTPIEIMLQTPPTIW